MFSDAYNKCYEKVTIFVAWLLCWPMKLTFVCNLVQALGGSSICDPEGKIDSGIGEGYAALKSTFSQNFHLPLTISCIKVQRSDSSSKVLETSSAGV